jgi:hypothetical protein
MSRNTTTLKMAENDSISVNRIFLKIFLPIADSMMPLHFNRDALFFYFSVPVLPAFPGILSPHRK